MNDNFFVTVDFDGEKYYFSNGSEAYIFHTAILNNLHRTLDRQGLFVYTNLVHDCLIKDDGHTPLGALADYVATHWQKVQYMPPREILRVFYDYMGTGCVA